MGNARSTARRSVHAFAMDDCSSSFAEPLLERHEKETTAAQPRKPRRQSKEANLQCQDATGSATDLAAVVHQLNSFYAVVGPVAITMVIASLLACYAKDEQISRAMSTYMYYKNIDSADTSLGEKSLLAFCNALFVIGFIACLTFSIVLLYKFNCMRFFLGYCILYSASLLAMAGTKIVVVILGQDLHVIFDSVSHWFVMYNFAIVGVLSIFYQKGIPRIVEQGYLVAISVIVAWQLSQLPEWSTWMTLLLLGFWDLFAVLTPIGPLRWLVDLVHEKGTPLPGLLFQAEVMDSHKDSDHDHSARKLPAEDVLPRQTTMPESEFFGLLMQSRSLHTAASPSPSRPGHVLGFHHQVLAFLFDHHSSLQHRAVDISQQYQDRQRELWRSLYVYYGVHHVLPSKPYPSVHAIFPHGVPRIPLEASSTSKSEANEDEDRSIRLGLGDFIFFSVLVARAALHGFVPFVACFLCVISGLAATMYLLAHFDALPALPLSVFSGIVAFVVAHELLAPFIAHLTSFSIDLL